MPSKHTVGLSFVEGLDVADVVSRTVTLPRIAEALGTHRLDVVVNNAGAYPQEWSAEALQRSLAVNALGPLRLADELLPFYAPGEALVVNVSSGLGDLWNISPRYQALLGAASSMEELAKLPFERDDEQSRKTAPAYAVSKGALNRGTQLLAKAWAKRGIRLHAVDPGWCKTDMGGARAPRAARDGALNILSVVEGAVGLSASGKVFNSSLKEIPWAPK